MNQVWQTDVKYGYIAGEKRFFFVQVVLDVYDRMVVDYHIGLTCTGREAAQALAGALELRQEERKGVPLVVRSDNGPQFLSQEFERACAEAGVEHELIPVRTPNKNAHVEAFHAQLEAECFAWHEFASYGEAYVATIKYLDYYSRFQRRRWS